VTGSTQRADAPLVRATDVLKTSSIHIIVQNIKTPVRTSQKERKKTNRECMIIKQSIRFGSDIFPVIDSISSSNGGSGMANVRNSGFLVLFFKLITFYLLSF